MSVPLQHGVGLLLREDEIGGDDHTLVLVPVGEEGKEHLHFIAVLLHVANMGGDNGSYSLGPYDINVPPWGYSDQKAPARMFLSGRKAGPNSPSYPAVARNHPLNPHNEGPKLVTEGFVGRPNRILPRRSCSEVKWPQTVGIVVAPRLDLGYRLACSTIACAV